MRSELFALLVLLILGKTGYAVRPVVTFNPNWDKIFTTESLTMTCNVRSPIPADMSYTWYKDNNLIHTGQSFVIGNAAQLNGGNYQCKGSNTDTSDSVRLDVSHGWVILQAPLYIHEGDNVTLRCHHYPTYTGRQSIFYKDNTEIRNWGSDPELRIINIKLQRSGKYTCTKEVFRHGSYWQNLGEASIYVKELFGAPEIKMTPNPVLEGNHMTLTCDSSLSPHRQATLQFAFYRDQLTVQNFTLSNQYGVQQAQLEDSGKYYCEAKTLNSDVKKRSNQLNIQINELFRAPEIKMTPNRVLEGDHMTLTCDSSLSPHRQATLQFAFYRDQLTVQNFTLSNQYGVQQAQLEDSGKYYCEAKTLNSNVKKRSNQLNIQINQPFTDLEIKGFPNPIAEGDNITLTCLSSRSQLESATEVQFAFHRNGQNVQEFGSSNKYGILFAKLEDSGYYICEGRNSANGLTKKSKKINVQIQELFSHPKIVTNPDFPKEGNRIILTCNTSINTLRSDIELQFAFYQNEKKVQKLNSSHHYIIPLAQLEDSGNYSCEARTQYNGMKKRSSVVSVVIQGTISIYLLIICPVTLLLLILAILGFFYMFRQRRSSVNNQDPMTGAPLRTDEGEVNNITYSAVRPKSMRRLAAAQEMSDEPENIYQNT
ncbi:Fc receptor-like protein 3 [Aquarana catesbeiana]|uniref:Fc receptor-like protein 3 n=1 Tax=Aquarana catesbeiana TaxID=8400 RepID=UPI003CC978AC